MAVALTNARLFEQLEHLKVGALTALARTIDAKSPWTAGHSERVTASACLLAAQLEMSGAELEVVRRGSLLHDIGKIGISAAILDKAGDLTTEEMREMQAHPEIGARILSPIEAYGDVLSIVLYHHERMNGQGYPAGLRGDAIPFHARIVAVADVYDALTSDRPYRGGWARQRAIAWIRSAAGPDLDPDVVAAFLRAVREDVTLGAAEIPAQPRLQLEDRKERV
jgi:putative nucleotidyltransferase with HDIG domain